MQRSESFDKVFNAFIAVQAEVAPIGKTATNDFLGGKKYAPLSSSWDVLRPLLKKYELGYFQEPCLMEDGKIAVKCTLVHISGQYIEFDPVAWVCEKNTLQSVGSCITYLRRYSMNSHFGLATDDDDDGNGASNPNPGGGTRTSSTSSSTSRKTTESTDTKPAGTAIPTSTKSGPPSSTASTASPSATPTTSAPAAPAAPTSAPASTGDKLMPTAKAGALKAKGKTGGLTEGELESIYNSFGSKNIGDLPESLFNDIRAKIQEAVDLKKAGKAG